MYFRNDIHRQDYEQALFKLGTDNYYKVAIYLLSSINYGLEFFSFTDTQLVFNQSLFNRLGSGEKIIIAITFNIINNANISDIDFSPFSIRHFLDSSLQKVYYQAMHMYFKII